MTIGAVVIGRNEGERLKRCLASLHGATDQIVYVDSGSIDGSVEHARSIGAEVVDLDTSRGFTAARARNAGLARLKDGHAPTYIQFVDGDCEVQPGWIAAARSFLDANPDAAIACGRRRERFPDASPYNRRCDREWDTPVGRTKACGGDALMRVVALEDVGGYNPGLIAGEEPEMCVRLRARGWEIWRLNEEMTLHDAAMTRFRQFWKRAQRGGFARIEGVAMHGGPPERHNVKETVRILFWGLALPIAIFIGVLVVSPWILVLALAYPLQTARIALREGGTTVAWEQAWLLTVGKFAETHGMFDYLWRRIRGVKGGLIEYK
ncbi:MAG: glycosyltransferase [Pseudomonadota bacterium]